MLKLLVCQCVNFIRINIFMHKISKLVICKEFPQIADENTLYITSEENELCYVLLKCPCGCGVNIDLSLIKGLKPRWTVEPHINGTVSITPSIWRKVGCRSHFFYKRGKIVWCHDEKYV